MTRPDGCGVNMAAGKLNRSCTARGGCAYAVYRAIPFATQVIFETTCTSLNGFHSIVVSIKAMVNRSYWLHSGHTYPLVQHHTAHSS